MTKHRKHQFSRRTCLKTAAAALASSVFSDVHAIPATTRAAANREASPIDVRDGRWLFCDGRFISQAENVVITMNPPAKLGPVLRPDRPWEDFRLTSYFTVVQDGALSRMYYSCFSQDQWNVPDAWENYSFLCYAESKDGLHWEKPELGLVEFNGSKKNNILMRQVVDGTVFIDPTAPAERRYKMLHTIGAHTRGLFVSYSSDGIYFTTPDAPACPWKPDSQQNAFYDTRRKAYVAYLRARPDMGLDPKRRSVARVEIQRIEQPWAKARPSIVFAADDADPAEVDFYTNACVQYPWAESAYFMFPACYHHYPKEFGNDGLLDSSAAFSHDGIQWQRPDRRPYVSLGVTGEWDSRFIMMGVGLVRQGDQLLQYYNGTDLGHGGTRKQSKEDAAQRRQWGWMGALRQRVDGFYSADGGYAGGTLTTSPLSFSGPNLLLNINASSAGSARIALLDVTGAPIPGYNASECDEILGNHLAHVVSWKGNRDLSPLYGRTIRMHFQMRSCKLYAFQFKAAQSE